VNNSEWTAAGDAVACLLPMSARNNRILHIDGDSFFASCEIALDPKLEGRPVWVGGGRRGDGIVIAANRQAKKYGIKTGTACFEAKRLCPNGVLCRPHYDAYRELSRQMFLILEQYAPTLVPYSIDEGFLDFSTMDSHVWRNTTPTDYVQDIRKRILKEVRLPVTAGLANSAKLAKLATDAAKGVGFIEVPHGGEKDFLNDRPVQELSGIAKNRQRSLAAFGAFTFGHVAKLPSMLLKQKFGIWGQQLWLFSNGQWNEPLVLEIKDRTTISSSTTLPQDEHDYEAALTFMLSESTRLNIDGDGVVEQPQIGDANGFLQIGQRGSRVNVFKAWVGHEIEDALCHERGERPAQRPQQNADKIHEVAVAGVLQRRDRHEADEQRRKRVAEIQDDGLEDVSPKHHQRTTCSASSRPSCSRSIRAQTSSSPAGRILRRRTARNFSAASPPEIGMPSS
jgi:nucleotidyltransferase/DNA polymerase involved in DNA repair